MDITIIPQREKHSRQFQDLTEQRFKRLLVLHRVVGQYANRVSWLCRCDCGSLKTILSAHLKDGSTKSCGCLLKISRPYVRKEGSGVRIGRPKTHGLSSSRIAIIWNCMKTRCYNKNHLHYNRYGGRGITVCERWLKSLTNFHNDVGDPPNGMTLDRFPDPDGNYEPGNVRWATRAQQAQNKTKIKLLIINGKEDSLLNWCHQFEMPYGIIYNRIRRGWDPVRALNTPIKGKADCIGGVYA